jgi:hypothetical protein
MTGNSYEEELHDLVSFTIPCRLVTLACSKDGRLDFTFPSYEDMSQSRKLSLKSDDYQGVVRFVKVFAGMKKAKNDWILKRSFR